jgi:putative aldouronate transport system substrate-binding protein
MTDESYYRLIQYGIQGRQYDIANGMVIQARNYNADVDGGGFAVWSLRNDKFNIPSASEDPRRYTLNAEWDKVAINNPYIGFSFNPSKVSAEISSITNVNSQLGIQILLGKTNDPKEAVARYRAQLTQAGIERVIAEVKSQLANFTPAP